MKILHTSDLHIGKRVNEFSMIDDQKYILQRIEQIVAEEEPDVVVIAGDVYNSATPSAEAVVLLSDFITQLHARCPHVVILSGNHDSAERLAFGSAIMRRNGVYFSQPFSPAPQKLTIPDAYGEVNIYLLPFVRPIDVRSAFKDALEDRGEPMERYDEAVAKAVEAMKPDYSARNILVAHQYIQGGERCEGEDVVGGLDEVDVEIVRQFDYVALGHLHRPQHVQYKHVRYSGSPLKYSFSEVQNTKSVSIIELSEKGRTTIRERELVPLHDWADLRGTYDELMSEAFYGGKGYENMYVRLTLTDEDEVVDAMNKLRNVYPLAMVLQYDNTRTRHNQQCVETEHVENKSPQELVCEFFEKQNGQPMNEAQSELVTNLIQAIFV